MGILSFILFLFVAAACAWIADYLVPGAIPGGFFVAVIFGIIGAWIGVSLVGPVGPNLAGVSLVPTILGSAILVFLVSFLGKQFARR